MAHVAFFGGYFDVLKVMRWVWTACHILCLGVACGKVFESMLGACAWWAAEGLEGGVCGVFGNVCKVPNALVKHRQRVAVHAFCWVMICGGAAQKVLKNFPLYLFTQAPTMNCKYLIIALLGLASATALQASTSQASSATSSPTAYVMPSLKDDIVKRYISWTLSPWIASLVYCVCAMFVGNQKQLNIGELAEFTLSTFICFVVDALLALVLASFAKMWKIQAGDKCDVPPFWPRFWRVFRFLGCTTLSVTVVVLLNFNKRFRKLLPKGFPLLFMLCIYPLVLPLIVAIICLIYDHAVGRGDKQKEGLPQEGTQSATPAPHDQPKRPAHKRSPLRPYRQ